MHRGMWNPAGSATGGARDRHTWRADGSQLSADRRGLQDSARLDELLCRLTDRLHFGRIEDEWSRNFARSILAQAGRGGWRWMPSPKQLAVIEAIVERKPSTADDDEPLIEETDHGL